jgi:hypothetical protein
MPASSVDVGRLPRHALRTGTVAFRIYRRLDDGRVRSPWYFSSAGSPASGRFDLPAPRGTCYFASTAIGAWLEVFGSTRVVAASDVRRRSLAVAERTGAPLSLGDLASRRSAIAGVTLDLTATDDYTAPQAVALAAFDRGHDGIRALLRRDPSGSSHGLALFGVAGAPTRQFGWRVAKAPLWRDATVLREVATLGVRVLDVPHDLPVTPVHSR